MRHHPFLLWLRLVSVRSFVRNPRPLALRSRRSAKANRRQQQQRTARIQYSALETAPARAAELRSTPGASGGMRWTQRRGNALLRPQGDFNAEGGLLLTGRRNICENIAVS
jgi:hypothetical protein